jgi:hypothetical protein
MKAMMRCDWDEVSRQWFSFHFRTQHVNDNFAPTQTFVQGVLSTPIWFLLYRKNQLSENYASTCTNFLIGARLWVCHSKLHFVVEFNPDFPFEPIT